MKMKRIYTQKKDYPAALALWQTAIIVPVSLIIFSGQISKSGQVDVCRYQGLYCHQGSSIEQKTSESLYF